MATAVVVAFRGFATGDATAPATGNETKHSKGGRPRKHADAAARQRAYRERNAGVVTWRLDENTVKKIVEIAAEVDLPANELANQIIKFGLSNRNWRVEPIFGKVLPNASLKPRARGEA